MTALPKVSAPAARALAAAGIETLEDVAATDRSELARLHGMGPKALAQLDAALTEAGLPRQVATVDGVVGAGRERRRVAGEPGDELGDLRRLPQPVEGVL